jgi:Ras-related GTP-binding protein C/D
VIFQNMSPHETLFLESTSSCDVSNNLSNRLVQFQTWDFGGDLDLSLQADVVCNTTASGPQPALALDAIFRSSNTLVYVIDAQEDDYEDALPQLAETISRAFLANPAMHFEVFLHKVDGDFMSDETKAERKQVRERERERERESACVCVCVCVCVYVCVCYDSDPTDR